MSKVNSKGLVIYKSANCPACGYIVPKLQKLAKEKKVSMKVVDVDKCGPGCDWIRYTPLITYNGREVSGESELKQIFGVK